MKYQVNITISSGVNFSQDFTVANPDMTPVNITGCKFAAKLSKHPMSVDAVNSTSQNRVQKALAFKCGVVDGTGGVVNIFMNGKTTEALPEGKYVYNVVMQDRNGNTSEVVGGLAFVEKAFAVTQDQEILFDGGSAVDDANAIILNGGTASGF